MPPMMASSSLVENICSPFCTRSSRRISSFIRASFTVPTKGDMSSARTKARKSCPGRIPAPHVLWNVDRRAMPCKTVRETTKTRVLRLPYRFGGQLLLFGQDTGRRMAVGALVGSQSVKTKGVTYVGPVSPRIRRERNTSGEYSTHVFSE